MLLNAAATLTFAGHCDIQIDNGPFQPIGDFAVGGDPTSCDGTTLNFSAVENGVTKDYGIYIEFQRGEFGPGLSEKLYIGYYGLTERTLENHATTFNATPGTVLDLEQKVGDATRLHCTGTVVE
jgi:hypothetical protein